VSSLLVLLLPAILVPCMCVGLILAVGSINAQRMRAESPGSGGGGDCLDKRLLAAAAYSSLPNGPDEASSSGSRDYRMPAAAQAPHGALGLITRTFNLKAMSRRAKARRLRRSARPVYVGLPQECAAQQQMYATGTLQPGPNCLVAPCFRWVTQEWWAGRASAERWLKKRWWMGSIDVHCVPVQSSAQLACVLPSCTCRH
jgi:hypothetical protein